MIRIGLIGIGFMGMTHFEGARQLKGAKVTAIATRDAKKRAGDCTSIQGNFGPRGGAELVAQSRRPGEEINAELAPGCRRRA